MNPFSGLKHSFASRHLFVPLVAVAILAPLRAWPCRYSCPEPPTVVAPGNGASDVPLNTRIWISARWRGLHLFEMPSLVEVPLKVSELSAPQNRSVGVYTPERLLSAHTTYILQHGDVVAEFTTGSEEDTTPPPPPRIVSETDVVDGYYGWYPPECGEESAYGVTYSVSAEGPITIAGKPDMIPAEFGDARFSDISTPDEAGQTSFFVGSRPGCVVISAARGSDPDIRFGTYDLAGNFSGFTDPDEQIPFGCGCSSGSEAGSALLLVVGMLGRRWRHSASGN